MSHVTVTYSKNLTQVKQMREIPEGTVFTGHVSSYDDAHLFLAAFECIVCLDNPHHTWSNRTGTVENYQPVDIEITVKPQRKNG